MVFIGPFRKNKIVRHLVITTPLGWQPGHKFQNPSHFRHIPGEDINTSNPSQQANINTGYAQVRYYKAAYHAMGKPLQRRPGINKVGLCKAPVA